jgi:hypothetical protein
MRFKCLTCERTISRWYDIDPVRGDLLARPWYIDAIGSQHLAIVCINCGTIHDCSRSLLRRLLSGGFRAPLKVHDDINPMELGMMIMDRTPNPSTDLRTFAINELGIPEEVVDILVARKLLGRAFAKSDK